MLQIPQDQCTTCGIRVTSAHQIMVRPRPGTIENPAAAGVFVSACVVPVRRAFYPEDIAEQAIIRRSGVSFLSAMAAGCSAC